MIVKQKFTFGVDSQKQKVYTLSELSERRGGN
nr:MAG TPA: hypothetical protein [Caudoviricetes sp.]